MIEYDKRSKKRELKFSARVKIVDGTNEIEFLGEYKLTVEAKEGWIKTDTYNSRTKFADFNRFDMGHGTKDGYRIYRSGSVRWTLPLRRYTN